MHKLVLLRHGESQWNLDNRFTGWTDVDLTPTGIEQARAAGRLLKSEGYEFDRTWTSVLKRAVWTLWHALDQMDRTWLPVRHDWRLNERHYGALQGLNKAETTKKFGEAQVLAWRRSYDVPPPPLPAEQDEVSRDPRYRFLAPDQLPRTECLKDVVARVLPWWHDQAAPSLRRGRTVLVVAHGNSLRALIKHLEGISDGEIAELNVPTGIPRIYNFDGSFRLAGAPHYLGDAAAAAERIAAVANQAKQR